MPKIIGWFGFNGGSEVAINSRAVNAVVISNICASVSGITWVLVEMIRTKSRRMSLNGFCNGAIVGSQRITLLLIFLFFFNFLFYYFKAS